MWHTLFIAAHAATGGIALLAGCLTLVRRGWFGLYLVSLAGMEVFLLAAVSVGWANTGVGARIIFVAFAALGAFMLVQADLARRCRPRDGSAASSVYVERVGFTIVSLFDAFIVILVLNAGAATWLVVTSGVAIAIAGHFGIRFARSRLATKPPQPADVPLSFSN